MQSICLMVTGAHRSMTSLLARQLSLTGLDFGDCLLPGDEFNPDGYFEDRPIVEFHRLLLHRRSQSWLTATEGASSLAMPQDIDFLQRYAAGRSSQQPVWAVKDPQLTLFVPLWRAAVAETRLLAVFRHPADVCRSVRNRSRRVSGNALEARQSRLLASDPDCAARMWLTYNQAILEAWNSAPSVTAVVGAPQLTRPECLGKLLKQRWQLPIETSLTTVLFDATRARNGSKTLEVSDEKLADAIRKTWQSLKEIEAGPLDPDHTESPSSLDIRVTDRVQQSQRTPGRIAKSLERSAEGIDRLCMHVRHRTRHLMLSKPETVRTGPGATGAD